MFATPAEATAFLVTDALIERFGLITIIVLGETLTGVALVVLLSIPWVFAVTRRLTRHPDAPAK